MVLGALGCVLPLLPVDFSEVRAYLPLPFAVAGIVLGVLGCVGRRRGKPAAGVGIALSFLALVLGVVLVAGVVSSGASTTPRERTRLLLQTDLDVTFSPGYTDAEGVERRTLTLTNKGSGTADFTVVIEQRDGPSGATCRSTVRASLGPGRTFQQVYDSCFHSAARPLLNSTLEVVDAAKSG